MRLLEKHLQVGDRAAVGKCYRCLSRSENVADAGEREDMDLHLAIIVRLAGPSGVGRLKLEAGL